MDDEYTSASILRVVPHDPAYAPFSPVSSSTVFSDECAVRTQGREKLIGTGTKRQRNES
jgi:hypothetical protein